MTPAQTTGAKRPGAALVPVDAYIDGTWVRGSGGRREVVNPADGSVLAEVSLSTVDECLAAVGAASRAQEAWSANSPRQRAQILLRAFDLMTRDAEELARIITLENGKVSGDARAEVAYTAEFFRWFAEESVRIPGDLRRSPAGHNWIMVSHEPVGVALLVTPWNFPAAMATRKIAPALAAGCSVVLKPAMQTPLAALFIARLLEEAGVPAGVVNVVLPDPPGPAVNAMLADARVRALSFTGSTQVGRVLLRQSAGTIVKNSMELGGNAPFIVFDDADLDEAAEGFLLAKLRNGGAACTAANRIFVQGGIRQEFLARITKRMAGLRIGPGSEPSSEIGAMVSQAERDRVAALVDRAVRDGARLVLGGSVPERSGFFFPPTVLDGVSPTSEIMQTEIFGPVAPIAAFDHADEAIAWANATDAGLVSYVYTRDLERGLSVSRRLACGMVGLNRGLVSDPAAPFGGSKHSGLGREGSHDGMLEFMETKYVATPYV
ncbi:NAD-dependent succinate-semialdehyde dehydrogenase [Streptomyces sp. NPDC056159]|uniref:NAD-dependent succinate-semialdehyde dehydrogenase n=1 Tax=unclassified Streptomyces TaxID=2593676 RepID=UPI00344055D4